MSHYHRYFCLLACLALPLSFFSSASSGQELSGPALLEVLQKGGYNIYFRHEATNWSQGDHVSQSNDWLSCDGARIRQLSE